MIVYGLAAALVVALVVIVWQRVEARRLRSYVAQLEARAERSRLEAMAAEARARDVGGRGEHGAPIVTPVDPIARTWTSPRDPRTAFPTDRPRQ